MNCLICHQPSFTLRGDKLIVTHNEHDHAAEMDAKEAVKQFLTSPDGVDAVREAIIETNSECVVR